jgi:hypothetical protein
MSWKKERLRERRWGGEKRGERKKGMSGMREGGGRIKKERER